MYDSSRKDNRIQNQETTEDNGNLVNRTFRTPSQAPAAHTVSAAGALQRGHFRG